jgi:hypothetical protein
LLKLRYLSVAFLVLLILVAVFAFQFFGFSFSEQNPARDEFYVGVAFCGNTTAEAKLLIDKVKGYSDLFVLQSGPVSMNETAIDEICDYAVAAKMSIIVYFGDLAPSVLERKDLSWRTSWVNSASSRFGSRFLGVYYYDEPGGLYLDTDKNATNWRIPPNSTYASVAQSFVSGFQRDGGTVDLKAQNISIFTSDYGLYWFDYLAGYDVVLAQVGWNHTLVQDVALLRGAANAQHKDWGAIITWKYDSPPYLANGDEIYDQMVSVYEAGAKYIAIFNYPYNGTGSYGTLRDEHFLALENFWNDAVVEGKIVHDSAKAEAVLVLPENYGWGMRTIEDKIWGFWGPDELSPQIWKISRVLLNQYGWKLDIVYDDPSLPAGQQYAYVYWWNSTLLFNSTKE